MSYLDRYWIAYNGEIYNYRELRLELQVLGYRFASDSDTEVLLACWAAWGRAALPKLRGMFAFALYDSTEQTLTCVRDAFGVKPFYYHASDGAFRFASEIAALLTLLPNRPTLNLQRAYDYLVAGGYDDQAATFFNEVHHLLPGHLLTVPLLVGGAPTLERWWWPSIAERSDLSFTQAAEQLRELFLANIRLHLRSDVPLGAALSGGVDSSAVVCAMRYVEPEMPIHTFSYVARNSAVDEEHWADIVNQQVRAIAHKVVVSPAELADDLDDMIRAQGEPFGSTSIYAQYRVFKLAREHGVTVTLDGQGADELLAGYNGYPGHRMRSLLDRREFGSLMRFLYGWSQWPGRSLRQGVIAIAGQFVPQPLRSFAKSLIGQNPEPAWLNGPALAEAGVHRTGLPVADFADGNCRRLMVALRRTLTGHGLNALLCHGDRNSMHWFIESRIPFLTTDMAEFLLSLPEEYLISPQGETKRVFRAAMRGIVPDVILDRKDKIGFETPEQHWLKTLGVQAMEWLNGAESLPFLDAARCWAEVKAIIQGHQRFDFQAWRLINFCRWVQVVGTTSCINSNTTPQ
jgi:asparagine synthase (glutamine-hydrolysing)